MFPNGNRNITFFRGVECTLAVIGTGGPLQCDALACDASRAKGERSGRRWGTGQGGEKRGRGAMGVEP
eukprot:9403443-Pyramimonas_sp.AAC.2